MLAAEYAESPIGKRFGLHCINVELDTGLYANLERNTLPYKGCVTNLPGAFGDNVNEIVQSIGKYPAIFFLDPFGVKGIEWVHVSRVLARANVTELLLRVNPIDIQRLAGFLDSTSPEAKGKCCLLTDLYGFADSSQWAQIWHSEGVDGLVGLYMQRLAEEMALRGGRMAYVCRYPIRSIEDELKYFLIFVTGHAKGAILMSDTVHNREEAYARDAKEYRSRQPQQLALFATPEPTEEEVFEAKARRLGEDIWQAFKGKTATRFSIREAMLENWFGKVKGSHFTYILKQMQEAGHIRDASGTVSDEGTVFTFSRDL